jgi:hypothetical protein
MANTPPSAHKSGPLQDILQSLNNPGSNKAVESQRIVDKNVAEISKTKKKNSQAVIEQDDALVTLLKVQRSSCRELYWTPVGIQSVNQTMMLW